jgi:alkylhydroperoxidase family enzyme
MFGALRRSLSLSPRHREMVILRIAIINKAPYEWYQHYGEFISGGGTRDEARALGRYDAVGDALFSALDIALLRYTDSVTKAVRVEDGLYDQVKGHFMAAASGAREGEGEGVDAEADCKMVELTALIGGYNMVSRVLVTLEITEEGEEGTGIAVEPMPIDCVTDSR